jgi:flagellar protein FliO/FliZ
MDVIDFFRYLVALMFVLAIAGTALLIKRYNANPASFKGKIKLGKWDFAAPEKRLAIVETLMLGPKQRLFIVRRDNVEHLVFCGPEGSSVIEANIPIVISAADRIAAS